MTNTAMFLHKAPGLLLPDVILKKASVAFPTAFGFCGREAGELKHEVIEKGLSLTELQELQQAFKDEDLVMFFANFPKAVVPDDVQPWMINDSHGNPLVALFFEGNCKDYEGLDGDHTGEYCASDEIIFPRLLKAGEVAGDDVQKMIAELNKPGLQKVLAGTFHERGSYLFLPREGPPIMFGPNPIGGKFPWGYASNTLGYKEEGSSKAAEVVKSSLTFLRGRGPSAEATPAPTPAVEDPKPDVGKPSVPAVPATPAVKLPGDADLEAKGYKRMFPPPKLGKGKARNLWIRTFNCIPDEEGKFGTLPSDHESSQCSVWVQPEFIELAQRVVSSKNEVDNLATNVHKLRKAGTVAPASGNVKPTAQQKATETAELARHELLSKPVGGEKPITRSNTRERYVPTTSKDVAVMSDENKELAMNRLAGYLDKHRPRPSPLELQKKESKHATFSESTGTSFEERLFLPREQVFDLFDGNEIATSAYLELKNRYIQDSGIKLEDLIVPTVEPKKEEEPETVTTVKKAGESTVLQESVVVPAKKGALSFLRGKAAAA